MNNPNFLLPKVFLIGETTLDIEGIRNYLIYTNQRDFADEIGDAIIQGIPSGEILCSFYAKLCYASLVLGKNDNISKIRSIEKNLLATIEQGHGSVFEHCSLNFVVTDCSRVFTHEMVRHRVGTAFSQTSGRYVRSNHLKVIIDPILEPIYEKIEAKRLSDEMFYNDCVAELRLEEMVNFDKKKKLTSALRRMMPNGQSNEIGVTLNLRTLRQTIEMRTSVHAEWEIRYVFNQIAELVKHKYKEMFADADFSETDQNGLMQITFKNKKI